MYTILKSLERTDTLTLLVKSGIISCSIINHKKVYEAFLFERKKGLGTVQSITNVSETFKLSESNVYRIIKKMKG